MKKKKKSIQFKTPLFKTSIVVHNTLANAGDVRDMGSIPRQEDLLEESMATHSSILSWRIL